MNSSLPPLYDAWVAELLPGPVPDESRATCSDCAMCSGENAVSFEAKTKCCTYIPAIPNFLAGRILEHDVAVFDSYWNRAEVRPQGVWPDRDFTAQYHPASSLFGRNLNWRCPYYLEEAGGLCGIWEHRNGRCATWFCKHVRGKISYDFWSSVETLLTSVEKILSLWCIHELKAGSDHFREIFPMTTDQPPFSLWLQQQSFYAGSRMPDVIWGRWLNREREFFGESARLVTALRWKDVRCIANSGLDPLERAMQKAYTRLTSDFFPDVVQLADFQQIDVSAADVRVWTTNPYDPITLPKATLRLLHSKNGSRMNELVNLVPHDLIIQLYDAGILI